MFLRPQQGFVGVAEERNDSITTDNDHVLQGVPGAGAVHDVLDGAGNQIFCKWATKVRVGLGVEKGDPRIVADIHHDPFHLGPSHESGKLVL